MKNKKGFTLVELLIVIVLLSIILVLVIPNLLKTYRGSNDKLTIFQKNQLKSAVELYINDTCLNPVSATTYCEFTTTTNEDGNILISNGSITLENFLTKNYLDSTGSLSKCSGNILIINNKVNVSNITCSL